ncbi:MAG: hypothetical protein GY704_02550, partial [Phycisphaeraceae bacterium]|nr:hypothetical protein [Phycisphaeraceae bacterium]
MSAAPDRPVVTLIDESSFAKLGDEWDDLLANSVAPTVFLTWAWVSSWRGTVGRDRQILVATARRRTDGLLLGVAPMTIERRTDGRVLRYRALQFIGGHATAADHLDLIVRTGHEDVAAPLWAAITAIDEWDVF